MQASSTAVLVDGTPAMTNGVASAVKHVVQALATSEHGTTAEVKLCAAVIGHVTVCAGGGLGGGSGKTVSINVNTFRPSGLRPPPNVTTFHGLQAAMPGLTAVPSMPFWVLTAYTDVVVNEPSHSDAPMPHCRPLNVPPPGGMKYRNKPLTVFTYGRDVAAVADPQSWPVAFWTYTPSQIVYPAVVGRDTPGTLAAPLH